jgi:hypothetical protein
VIADDLTHNHERGQLRLYNDLVEDALAIGSAYFGVNEVAAIAAAAVATRALICPTIASIASIASIRADGTSESAVSATRVDGS